MTATGCKLSVTTRSWLNHDIDPGHSWSQHLRLGGLFSRHTPHHVGATGERLAALSRQRTTSTAPHNPRVFRRVDKSLDTYRSAQGRNAGLALREVCVSTRLRQLLASQGRHHDPSHANTLDRQHGAKIPLPCISFTGR